MKDERDLENKSVKPAANKAEEKIKIQLRPGRAVTGVEADKDGYAYVDAATAKRLIQIGYATEA